MTQEQTEQLIKELHNCKIEAVKKQIKSAKASDENFYRGEVSAFSRAIQLLKQTTVNRSSTEPKFIEG